MKVFVFLPRMLDGKQWPKRFMSGEAPDLTPYGYHFAELFGAEVFFSEPTPYRGLFVDILEKSVRKILGFDIFHAWRNRRHLLTVSKYDVIWTHTEIEHLAVSALRLLRGQSGPPVVAQSVWLMDNWPKWSYVRQQVNRSLLQRSAIATFHSVENLAFARKLNLSIECELVPFGISLDSFPLTTPVEHETYGNRVRVLALGNDQHRDWATMYKAVAGRAKYEVRVATAKWPRKLTAPNIFTKRHTLSEIKFAYHWADCVVVPLTSNLHASGITTILEAVASGKPVVATSTGGLLSYFDERAVEYVPVGNHRAMRAAIDRLARSPSYALTRVLAGQRQIVSKNWTTYGFAKRHVELSQRILTKEHQHRRRT